MTVVAIGQARKCEAVGAAIFDFAVVQLQIKKMQLSIKIPVMN